MNGARQSPAEDTAELLVQAEGSDSPVLSPGAFEKRAAGAAAPRRSRADEVDTDRAHPIGAAGRERLDHEREGGAAPSARAGSRSGTFAARLWHSLLHPMHLPDIWRRVLLQAS
jgi:hypothetical protein